MKFQIISENSESREMLEAIKRRHHHDNGSESKLELIDDSKGIERKVIEEEHNWKLQTQENTGKSNGGQSDEEKINLAKQESAEVPIPAKKQNIIIAGCNCGRTFSAEKGENEIRVTAFDNAGKVSGSYTLSGSNVIYGVSGQQGESYAAPGSTNESYR